MKRTLLLLACLLPLAAEAQPVPYGPWSPGGGGGGGGTPANPTATAGPTAINGTATTYMRSDAAPAVQTATTGQLGLVKPDGTTITISGGTISAVGGSATSITVGTTTVGSGTPNGLIYDNAGVVGNLATANSGVLVTSGAGVPSISTTLPGGLAMGTPASITLTNGTGLPIGGLTGLGTGVSGALAAAVSGSGSIALTTSPAFTTPALGTPSALVCTNCTGTAASLTAGTATVANGLKSATTTVAVSSATAPTNGQVLTATSSTAATWQTPTTGSGTVNSGTSGQVAYYASSGTAVSGATLGTNLSVSGGTLNPTYPVATTQTANYTFAATEMGKTVPLNISGGGTLTIPATGFFSTIFGAGQLACAININAGTTTVTNSSGATMVPTITSLPTGYTLCLQADSTGANLLATVNTPASLQTNLIGQAFTGGLHPTAYSNGTFTTGTATIDCGNGPIQTLTNNGAFTLAMSANDGNCTVRVTNGASAGAVTFSGFSEGSNTGDSLTTTNTNKFDIVLTRIGGSPHYLVSALQ